MIPYTPLQQSASEREQIYSLSFATLNVKALRLEAFACSAANLQEFSAFPLDSKRNERISTLLEGTERVYRKSLPAEAYIVNEELTIRVWMDEVVSEIKQQSPSTNFILKFSAGTSLLLCSSPRLLMRSLCADSVEEGCELANVQPIHSALCITDMALTCFGGAQHISIAAHDVTTGNPLAGVSVVMSEAVGVGVC